MKVLVIRLSAIGDVLHATPVVRNLKASYPDSQVSWLVETMSSSVLDGNPYLDEVIIWPRKEWQKEFYSKGNVLSYIKQYKAFISLIKERRFDLVLDLHGMIRGSLLGYLAGAPKRYCLSDAREFTDWLATNVVDVGRPAVVQDRYLAILKPLGFRVLDRTMDFTVSSQALTESGKLISDHGIVNQKYVVINPMTSNPSKNWSPDRYALLGQRIIDETGKSVIITGSSADKAVAECIVTLMNRPCVNLAGRTSLQVLGAVIKRSSVFLSGDTGPLYIASALGTPTVSIFGPTDPSYWAPKGEQHISIRGKNDITDNVLVEDVFREVVRLMTEYKN